jgi:oligoribonuclease
MQIEARVALTRVPRQRQIRVEADDRKVEHGARVTIAQPVGRSLAGSKVAGMLVWMDLEMTGLDPRSDVIVEIATLVTDDDLTIVAEGPDLVINHPLDVLARMDDFVRNMHTKSGLLPAISSSTITLEEAGAATLAFLKEHVPVERTVPLCGNSIGTDRRFLDAYLPEIENWLHYRSIDVSSIKELVRRWYPSVRAARPMKTGSHRALDDIRESIEELRYYREHVFRPPPAVGSEATAP